MSKRMKLSLLIIGAIIISSIAAYSYFSEKQEVDDEKSRDEAAMLVAEEELKKIKNSVSMDFTDEDVLEAFPLPTNDTKEQIEKDKVEIEGERNWNESNLEGVYDVFKDAVKYMDFPFMELVKEDIIRILEDEKELLMKERQLELREEQLN